ncbi:MAG: GNAT family N-acetyltransferase [Anaerolineales bacterium]
MTFPPMDTVLEAHGLRLVPVFTAPAAAVLEAVRESLPELKPWMSWAGADYHADQLRGWLEGQKRLWMEGQEFNFTIFAHAQGAALGGVGLDHINPAYRLANLGYWVRTSATRRGIASRAARMVARFGFETLGLLRAEIVMAEANLPSQRTAEKAGARRERLLRQRIWAHGHYGPAWMFSLLPQDFGLDLAVMDAAWQRFSGSAAA